MNTRAHMVYAVRLQSIVHEYNSFKLTIMFCTKSEYLFVKKKRIKKLYTQTIAVFYMFLKLKWCIPSLHKFI